MENATALLLIVLVRFSSFQLKPRSNRFNQVDAVADPPLAPNSKGNKSNPFGSAKPRELVLKEKGVDVRSLDAKFEAKAKVSKFSVEQEAQIEAVREELTRLETMWREANEKELPEEMYRVKAEAKREELKVLLKKFSAGSTTTKTTSTASISATEKSTESRGRRDSSSRSSSVFSRQDGFTPVLKHSSPRRSSGHYLPAKEGNTGRGGVDPFVGMSRHRFGQAAN